ENCPIGLRAIRNAYRRAAAFFAAFTSILLSIVPGHAEGDESSGKSNPPTDMSKYSHQPGDNQYGEATEMGRPTLHRRSDSSYQTQLLEFIEKNLPGVARLRKGTVLATIEKNGTISKVSIATSTGYKKSDSELLQALRGTRLRPFPPGTGGINISVYA